MLITFSHARKQLATLSGDAVIRSITNATDKHFRNEVLRAAEVENSDREFKGSHDEENFGRPANPCRIRLLPHIRNALALKVPRARLPEAIELDQLSKVMLQKLISIVTAEVAAAGRVGV
jgi:hypothetical protein